jgi:hypothetical protein
MTPTIFLPRTCWFCLALGTLALRLDRKSKPYLGCAACGAHAFLRTPAALAGVAIVSPTVEQIRAALSTNPAFAMQQQEIFMTFKRELLAAIQPPPESAVTNGATYRDLLANDKRKVV